MKRTALSWPVLYYDSNSNEIKTYNVISHVEHEIKKFKKMCSSKTEFAMKLRQELMYRFWSKAECELVVEIDETQQVWLTPWVGCRNPDYVRINVTDNVDFDWGSFAQHHINQQIYKNKAKIDIFDQIDWKWSDFVDYCWCNRFKYERDNLKFHEKNVEYE